MRALKLAAALVLASACEVGNHLIAERTVEVPEFDSIRIDRQIDVEVLVSPGSGYSVTFRTDSNLIDDDELKAVVEARELSFKLPSQEINWASERRAVVRTPSLTRALLIDGSSGTLVATGLSGEKFYASCANGGKATLSGQVDEATLDASGDAVLDAAQLTARTAIVTATVSYTSPPTVSARATESVTIETDGAAKVHVYGSPANVEKNENPSAEVVIE